MALWLRSEQCGFEPWPGTLCCVLGQDTLLSLFLSALRCINGLASHPGGSRNTPSRFMVYMYRNKDKLWPEGPQLAHM